MHKRFFSLILAGCMVCSITACGNQIYVEPEAAHAAPGTSIASGSAVSSIEQSNPLDSSTTEQTDSSSINSQDMVASDLDEITGGLAVEQNTDEDLIIITIPKSYLDEYENFLPGELPEPNADGSVTLRLTKAQHQQLLQKLDAYFDDLIDETLSSGDYPSVQTIRFNDDYTSAVMTVDYDAYLNSLDALILYSISIVGPTYQVISGVPEDEVNTAISIVDSATGLTKDVVNAPSGLPDLEQ